MSAYDLKKTPSATSGHGYVSNQKKISGDVLLGAGERGTDDGRVSFWTRSRARVGGSAIPEAVSRPNHNPVRVRPDVRPHE